MSKSLTPIIKRFGANAPQGRRSHPTYPV